MYDEERLKTDFRAFLYVVWQYIDLPDPTPLQYDIARFLQSGPNKICIEAFRGVGKSFITSAYVLWRLNQNPQLKFLVVSASKSRADAFTTFTMRLIQEMPLLAHLRPRPEQRNSRIEFDVGPATADQSPSVKSVGITGQLTGSRADEIIADDVEVLNNAATADMREKLLERIKEFSAILKPLPTARTIYLGTPQTEDSIYNKLPDTFEIRIWPAMVPTPLEMEKYGDSLAPYVRKLAEKKEAGSTTDPQRFTDLDLAARQAEYGKSGFALQFMLNTSLSDTERYPLKVRDLVVMDCDISRAPMKVDWLPDYKREHKELPNLAMAGDRFFAPASHSDTFAEYTGTVMAIDPAGRGKDETGYAVVKMLNGFLYVTKCGGFAGGYDNPTLQKLAIIAKEQQVNQIVIEANFGDGMYTSLFKPVVSKIHPCAIEEVKHSVQKERRIIDTLEPVMARHKLIFDRTLVDEDYKTAQAYDGDSRFTKSLVYQMTRISYAKGSLKHDDRLDALSIAVNHWVENMAQDADRGISAEKNELLNKELEKFMDHALGRQTNGPSNNWNPIHGR
jgi:Holliday junction resolvasome RuvABC endonuclease subunit